MCQLTRVPTLKHCHFCKQRRCHRLRSNDNTWDYYTRVCVWMCIYGHVGTPEWVFRGSYECTMRVPSRHTGSLSFNPGVLAFFTHTKKYRRQQNAAIYSHTVWLGMLLLNRDREFCTGIRIHCRCEPVRCGSRLCWWLILWAVITCIIVKKNAPGTLSWPLNQPLYRHHHSVECRCRFLPGRDSVWLMQNVCLRSLPL